MNNLRIKAGSQPLASEGFASLGLSNHLCATVAAAGYVTPTPIQTQAIPHLIEGRDLLGCAQTGTGKTAAFALPILQAAMGSRPTAERSSRAIRALVLAPTRELAAQIGASFTTYAGPTGPRQQTVFGGVNKRPQTSALRRGCDVLVATPGRLLDLMNDGVVDFSRLSTFVLDEADRMLDMGFIRDVRRIAAALPAKRQTLMFSATMPTEIQRLADRILQHPVRVAVDPISSARPPIEQSVYQVEKALKNSLLVKLLSDDSIANALVFTRTKHGANRVARHLAAAGIQSAAIHGNKSQSARVRALNDFKTGRVRVIVATDIAARGIDIKELSHVINFDLPNEPETYVHRIGRTGRAGASGVAIAFCSSEERAYLRDIERLTATRVPICATPDGLSSKRRGNSPGAAKPALRSDHRDGARRHNRRRIRRRAATGDVCTWEQAARAERGLTQNKPASKKTTATRNKRARPNSKERHR